MVDKSFIVNETGLKLLQYLTEGSYGSMKERKEYESLFSSLSAETNLPVGELKRFVVRFLEYTICSDCEDTH